MSVLREQPLQVGDAVNGLSLRANFAWALAGNVVYAACQWGMIVAIAKLGSSIMVGQFSLGIAIATPVVMFTNLQLRPVLATDATRQYAFGEYLGLRLALTLIAMAAIAGIVNIGRYRHGTAVVILAVASAKGLETLSDIFYGLFQLNDRLDHIGTSMILRGVLALAALGSGLYFTRDVFWGVIALAVVWLVVLLCLDARRARRFVRPPEMDPRALGRQEGWRRIRPRWHLSRQWKLAYFAFPLGIVMTLVSLNLHMPRYFVEAHMGEEDLGIFSALAYTTVSVAMVADALAHSTLPCLSRLYASGLYGEFRRLLLKLEFSGAGVGLAGILVARFWGARLLTILFSAKYAAYAHVFVWLVIAAIFSCSAFLLTAAMTAAQCFRIQVVMFGLVVGINALMCAWLVPTGGLAGAAKAVLIAALAHFAMAASIMLFLLSRTRTRLATEA
jgi:O-antigen/teichoic acid export membrane protein